ncbi:MAG: hypothetical protein RL173_1006 [Fibrobacterota bacterium]
MHDPWPLHEVDSVLLEPDKNRTPAQLFCPAQVASDLGVAPAMVQALRNSASDFAARSAVRAAA